MTWNWAIKIALIRFFDMIVVDFILCAMLHAHCVCAWHTYCWGRTKQKVKDRECGPHFTRLWLRFSSLFILCHFYHGCYYIKHFIEICAWKKIEMHFYHMNIECCFNNTPPLHRLSSHSRARFTYSVRFPIRKSTSYFYERRFIIGGGMTKTSIVIFPR